MKNAYIKFILAAVIFGTNGIIARHIPLSSYEIVLTRTVLGGFFLLILATARREWGSLRRASRTSLVWLVLSGLFLSGNWLFLYEAYQHIGVSLATLMCYCGPILIMILSYFVFHEPFTVPKVSAMVIVTVGILCINGAADQAPRQAVGLVCGFLSAVCFALLVIAMKKVSGIGGILSPACQLLVASLVVAAVTLSMPTAPVSLDMTHIACMVCLGIVNTGLGYYLYFSGVQHLSAIILGESLTLPQWLGAACILGGVALSELWHPGKKG